MSLLVRFLGPFYGLIISTVLLVTLALHYPMTQDVWVTRFIITFGCVGYLSILITDMITDMICHHISMTLKLLLIPVTVCTHVLRFASQGQLAQLEAAPFICSLIGVIPGVLCLIPLDGEFVAHLLRDLAFNIATLVGATSRLLDAIVICFHKTRESANYFRCRLQECFL
ncbi:hypothetical protein QOZ80_1AG0034990 [Eleusine coracana subsp. coracana]|nr:hypothetical protein QOZ80_1AG0034990 [Eleusine coracana subsp. coracana]